jgi:hypothetical protein
MIDIDKEREIHRIVASLQENLEVSFNFEIFERWIEYLTRIISELSNKLQ